MPLIAPIVVAAILAVAAACSGRTSDPAAWSSPSTPTADSAPTSAPTQSPSATTTPMRLSMTPAQARDDIGELLDSACFASHATTSAPDPEDCSYGYFDGDTAVLYGDTHAAQWFSAAVEVAGRHDWRLLPVTKADCPPGGAHVLTPDLRVEYSECVTWHARAMKLIATQEPVLVLVAARSDHYRIAGEEGEPLSAAESAAHLSQALADDLGRFADMGARTLLIRDTQVPGFDVPSCVEAGGPQSCGYRLQGTEPDDTAQRAAARATGTPVIDLRREICGDRAQCLSVIDELITFRDAEHVTSTFGASLADQLEAGIDALPA